MRNHTLLNHRQITGFIARHRLPDAFRELIVRHYAPLASWLMRTRRTTEVLFVGINGAQGTGKSTLADYLKLALESGAGWQVAVLSIDDFYLTKAERQRLAGRIHPLLKTRGVPGTHDVQMLTSCVERLRNLAATDSLALPCFDKAIDDRAAGDSGSIVTGPVDLIILEGWCVGTASQQESSLTRAINSLEESQDPSGAWRRYINAQLDGDYAELFAQLDALIFLQAPSFDAVCRWRLEQEEKLAEVSSGNAEAVMSAERIAFFIQHFERLTRLNMETLPQSAEVVLELNENHGCVRSIYSGPVN